jgi:type I restriction enzyme M protein
VLGGHRLQRRAQAGRRRNRDVHSAGWSSTSRKVDLRNANLSEPDMLGRAYEYLIEKFADDAGKKGGEFYTPSQVVRLIVELLQPKPRACASATRPAARAAC